MSLNILNIVSKELIEQLGLKPLVGEERVTFQLLRAGRVDPTSTRAVATPQFQGIAPYCDISDPFDKHAGIKRIMNITGYRPIQGKPGEATIQDPIVGYVRFMETGQVTCDAETNNLYFFLKLHNKNSSNPNRRTKESDGRAIPVIFFEVDVKKEIQIKSNNFDYQFLASKILVEADEDGIFDIAIKLQRAYPTKYTFDLKAAVSSLRVSLQHAATNDSLNFILAMKEQYSLNRVLVDDAINRKKIFFNDHAEKRSWNWKRTPGEKGKKTIMSVENGNDPVKALVEYLTAKDGSDDMVEIKQLYEEHYLKK